MTPPSPSSGSMRSHAIGARGRSGGCAPSTHVRRPCSARRAFDGVVTGSVASCDRSTSFGRPSFMTKSDWPTKAGGVRPFFTGVRVPLGLGLTPLTSIDSSARRPLLNSSAKSEAARACSERLTTLTPPDLRDGVPCRELVATPKPPQPKDRSSSASGAASMTASAKRRTK